MLPKFRCYIRSTGDIREAVAIVQMDEWLRIFPDGYDRNFLMSEWGIELMQCTGLKDKKLDYIYDMDIIDSYWNIIWNFYENSNLLETDSNFLIKGMGTKEWEESYKEANRRWCEYAK